MGSEVTQCININGFKNYSAEEILWQFSILLFPCVPQANNTSEPQMIDFFQPHCLPPLPLVEISLFVI